ncbi:hypothetical protein [Streptomyces chiangmaiensis]|uniref:hypothetical protein n=1 Tax=Streptomyces chiangmaiensis TaxID=766497 RepID=UPI0038B583AC
MSSPVSPGSCATSPSPRNWRRTRWSPPWSGEARAEFERAASLAGNERERELLRARAEDCR